MVFFLHGLNTFGDDEIHIGALKLGPMHAHIERELKSLNVTIKSLEGLGHGSPEELAERAWPLMKNEKEIIIVGHSIGGLVARAIADKHEVKRIITIGTPHHGTRSAQLAHEIRNDWPRLTRLLKRTGYDLDQKAETIKHFTPESLRTFNERHPAKTEEISLLCEVPRRRLNLLYRAAHSRFHDAKEASDGFISTESQKRGQSEGPFELDHFAQIGCYLYLSPGARRRAHEEFQRLMQRVASNVSK